MLVISGASIDQAVTPLRMIAAVEKAFSIFGCGAYEMPNRFACENKGITSLYMPCYTEQSFGTKMLTLVPENRARGLASIDGVMLLNDRQTGSVKALIDAKALTAWRTGATGAMAVRHLARKDAGSLGIVGCGVQGLYQAICICAVREIKNIFLFNRSDVKESFLQKLRARIPPQVTITICSNTEELVRQSDIVVTTTFANTPVLPEDQSLLKGKCYIAVGSYKPEMRELPDALFAVADKVYVDLPYACEESGDLIDPMRAGILKPEQISLIHEVIHKEPGRKKGRTIVFKTVGMALVDLLAAEEICRAAEEQGQAAEFVL